MAGIVAGEPILESKLASRDSGRGLAALIPEGMRAYTIQTSRVASNVAGFILPGNSVDVLLTLKGNYNDTTGGGSTTTLLQAVEILAVDQRLDAPVDNKINPRELGSVTLLVTPEQAALLDLGQNMGTLTLSLRNPEDAAESLARPATVNDIRFRQEKPVEKSEGDSPILGSGDGEEVLEIVTLRGSHRGRVLVTRPN
jgi:pilus assembly protein CpaB